MSNSDKKPASFYRKKKRIKPSAAIEKDEIALLDAQNLQQTKVEITEFESLQISAKTKQGLKAGNFTTMTDIQRKALPIALSKKDILGAAKTGSGKTLAFIIPVLELLYRAEWTPMDGLGGLIISPTRELAQQIFNVLRNVGKFHTFSAGLLIGGKDLNAEKQRVGRMNILVATPGRLLQHMDQTPEFTCDNLRVLVLDEADRILDAGFQKTVNAIIENLPRQRCTLLFSATQTKSVKDLARLSLTDPEYVAVHEKSESSTPASLSQSYIFVDLPRKLEVLYSFIKSHQKSKIVVFLSSCKQVRLVHEAFCKMQPGIPLMCLHGKQKQSKRSAIFDQFCRKTVVCLFATDVAARGLDFPSVDWVVQVDCPEDPETYIHRVGRTARNDAKGNALLFLLPSEAAFVPRLEAKRIPITQTHINPLKMESGRGVASSLAAYCSQDPELKYLAQKSFISYVRSVHLQKDKGVFSVQGLGDLGAFAESLGLPGTPKIKFVGNQAVKREKNASWQVEAAAHDDLALPEKKHLSKVERLFKKKNQSVLTQHYQKLAGNNGSSDDDCKINDSESDTEFTLKRADHPIDTGGGEPRAPSLVTSLTHRQLLKINEKEAKKRPSGQKFHFDEHGNPVLSFAFEGLDAYRERVGPDVLGIADKRMSEEAGKLAVADLVDKSALKERRREEKRARKRKEREAAGIVDGGCVTLGPRSDDEEVVDDIEEKEEEEEEEVGDSGSEGSHQADVPSDLESDDANLDIKLSETDDEEAASPVSPPTHSKRKKHTGYREELGTKKPKRQKSQYDGMERSMLEEIASKLLRT